MIYPNDHRPAHVHVIGSGQECIFELNCSEEPVSLRENYGFARHELNSIQKSLGERGAARAKAGIIQLKVKEPLSAEAMRAKLLSLAKDQGRDVYEVETLGGELAPRVLYRVSPDGKRTLVRGAVFDELDQRSLRSEIIAAGGVPWVAQAVSPVPQSTVVPELLFADIAVKRATQEQAKLPYYPPPVTPQ